MEGNRKSKYNINLIISTFFGAGYFPKMPGTFASIIAFIPVFGLNYFDDDIRPIGLFSAVVIICISCIPLIARAEKVLGSDSPKIVIDEVIGVWLIYSSPFLPITILSFVLGIGLFRFFDILKPSIIGKINEKKGAVYVILDDICASVATIIILHLFYFIGKFLLFYRLIFTNI